MALERNACVSKLSVALSERELCLLGCEGRGNWLSVDISYLRICLFFGCFFCSLLSIKFQLEVSACPVFLLSAVCFFFFALLTSSMHNQLAQSAHFEGCI